MKAKIIFGGSYLAGFLIAAIALVLAILGPRDEQGAAPLFVTFVFALMASVSLLTALWHIFRRSCFSYPKLAGLSLGLTSACLFILLTQLPPFS
jgi:hypothetical protein